MFQISRKDGQTQAADARQDSRLFIVTPEESETESFSLSTLPTISWTLTTIIIISLLLHHCKCCLKNLNQNYDKKHYSRS